MLKEVVKEAFGDMDIYGSYRAFFRETTVEGGILRRTWKYAEFGKDMDSPSSWDDQSIALAQEIVSLDPNAVFLNADRVEDFKKRLVAGSP